MKRSEENVIKWFKMELINTCICLKEYSISLYPVVKYETQDKSIRIDIYPSDSQSR